MAQGVRPGGRVGENQCGQHRGRPALQLLQAAAEYLPDFGGRQLFVVKNIGDTGEEDSLHSVTPRRRRRARDQLRQLKAGESAGEMDPLEKFLRGASAAMGESRQAVGVEAVGCVQKKDGFAAQQRPRQEIMRQARALRMPVHHHQPAPPRERPQQAAGLRGEAGQGYRYGRKESHNHLELAGYFQFSL